jgi:hypothetical protein
MKTILVRDVRRWRNVTSCERTAHNVSYVSVGRVLRAEKQSGSEEVKLDVSRICPQRIDTGVRVKCHLFSDTHMVSRSTPTMYPFS